MSRSSSTIRRFTLSASAMLVALSAASVATAAENGNQRYSAGIGGSDMTTPVVPGLYFQVPMVAYSADEIKGNDGKQRQILGAPINIDTSTSAVLPRLTYISGHHLLGANVGITAMLPVVKREATLSTVDPASPLASIVSAKNGSASGFADLEISPVMHWEIGDHQSVTFAPTVIMPLGGFNKDRRANSGFGDYYTFRPSVQYAFIGDGWDLGGRAVMSFNTRNKQSGYYSGKIFNFDWQAMTFVSEDIRVGVQGYFVRQVQADTSTDAIDQALINAEKGAKASVNAIGPAVGWLMNGGEMLIEGKFMKEFGAKNRTEGQAFWFTISKPL